MIEYEFRFVQQGPLFDGQINRDIDRAMVEALDAVASQGQADVHLILDRSIKHPTPYYETQITVDRATPDRRVVHDRGVVYGPWLEGVSSRNQSTSFKGYHAFRRAAHDLQAKVPALADPIFRRAIGG